MGRGRAKAKQTKVARQLKYHTPRTDLGALERELGGAKGSDHPGTVDDELEDEFDEDDAGAPDEDRWAPRTR